MRTRFSEASAAGGKDERQRVQRPEPRCVLEHGSFGELVLGDAAVELTQGYPKLHPSEVRAEAAVYAAAEGQVRVGVAAQVDRVDPWVIGVAGVGRPEQQHDLLARLDGTTTDHHVLGG